MTEAKEQKDSLRCSSGSLDKGEVYDECIAIGPLIMMKNVVKITKPADLDTMVSLNPIMIDGTGMCGGYSVTIWRRN